METIQVILVRLNNGKQVLKYPCTPVLWNMEGYYFPPVDGAMIKLNPEQVETLVPKA